MQNPNYPVNPDAKALTVQEITTLIGTPFYDTFKPL